MLKTSLSIILLLMANIALSEPVVIVHPSNKSVLSYKVIKRIFLGKENKFSDGSETVPVNQIQLSKTRQDFDQIFLKKSTNKVVANWSKLVFTGKGIPPKELKGDAEVIDLVSANPNVIGYIDRASVTDLVKVIEL